MSVTRTRVWLTGRVQGVSFRYECARAARAAGVGGWVRNRLDGRVEAVFEGPPEAVAAMVEWCRRGPPAAYVTHVETRDEPPMGERELRVLPTE